MRIKLLRYQTMDDFFAAGMHLSKLLGMPYTFLNEWCVMVGGISFIRDTHNVCWLATADAGVIQKLTHILIDDPAYELNPGFYR